MKNVRGRIEKVKTDKEGEIAKAAEKANAEEAAQPAPAGEGAQGGGAPGGEPGKDAAAQPPGAAGPEEKRKNIIQNGECDGDVALALIKESFGTIKKQPQRGEVQYLPESELKAKWNSVYGDGDWEANVEGKGKLYGWNYNGINYVNKDTNESKGTALTTLVHEMLHENSDWSFRAAFENMGLNEGVTDYLTRELCRKHGVKENVVYPKQIEVVEAMFGVGLSQNFLKDCYFNTGPVPLANWVRQKCDTDIHEVDQLTAMGDYGNAKGALKRK